MAGRRVIISGIGQSAVARALPQTGLSLTVDAVREAIADAGLAIADIDGMATYPGLILDNPAFSPVGTFELRDALGFTLDWYAGGGEGSAQLGAVINAYAAIMAGLARHVVCFRTVKEGSSGAAWKKSVRIQSERTRIGGEWQYIFPYDAISATNWIAQAAARHCHLYGTTREQIGAIAIAERAAAARNPKALFRTPLTMDEYLSARMISTPLGLLDCDAPTDASTAFVLSASDAVADSGRAAVRIESVGGGIDGPTGWDQRDLPDSAAAHAARMLWARTDLRPADVDVALLYDGFSFLALDWLEVLGFCARGEGGPFVEGGTRIALDGELPLNPHGGQLSAGRTHGFGLIHEAVVQLRGAGGDRQVPRDPKVAVVSNGAGPMAGALLLVRE